MYVVAIIHSDCYTHIIMYYIQFPGSIAAVDLLNEGGTIVHGLQE